MKRDYEWKCLLGDKNDVELKDRRGGRAGGRGRGCTRPASVWAPVRSQGGEFTQQLCGRLEGLVSSS